MKNELQKYIERMNKYNEWEEEYRIKNPFSVDQKIKQYLQLMEIAYNITPPEKLEKIHNEKLERIIKERKMLMRIKKEYNL